MRRAVNGYMVIVFSADHIAGGGQLGAIAVNWLREKKIEVVLQISRSVSHDARAWSLRAGLPPWRVATERFSVV
jgi:hypothetical protein